jgi:hypothetical protein
MKNLEDKIKEILFELGKEIKIHKIDEKNMILEIYYDDYSNKLLKLFKEYSGEKNVF